MSTSHLLALLVQSCQKRRCNRSANGGSCFFRSRTMTAVSRCAKCGLVLPRAGVYPDLEGLKGKKRFLPVEDLFWKSRPPAPTPSFTEPQIRVAESHQRRLLR